MAILKCKMCGGDMNISQDKTFGTCEYCGSTMTLPRVSDDQRAAAFNRGNHFRRSGEFDKALAVYERIVAEDDTDAEAHWCCALCRFGIEYVEDPATYEYLPTCHRASFDSFLEDVDYLAAVEHSDGITRRQYQKDAAKIAEVQKGILATSQNEEPFDVFICYKESDENGQRTKDSTLAQDIYYQLTDQGRRVFFARITLEDKAGTQYEPYIFAALNSAKVMVAVGTTAEHFNAVWVKNEWSRFLAMMKKDRSKLLLPCYRDMDPYDLPEQLSVLQSYDMGKIGFMQDLIRGINKVLDADKKPEPVPAVQQVVQQSGGGNADALLDRGYMALEDCDWAKADDFFEQVLNQDARNARAYLGKFLAGQKCAKLEQFVKQMSVPGEKTVSGMGFAEYPKIAFERTAAAVKRCEVEGYLTSLDIERAFSDPSRIYSSYTMTRRRQLADMETLLSGDQNLLRATQYAVGDVAKQLDTAKTAIRSALEKGIQEAEAEDKANDERITKLCMEALDKADKTCDQLCAEAKKEKEQDEIAFQRNARIAKKVAKIGVPALAVVIAAILLITKVIIPNGKYSAAEKLLEAGDFDGAISAFTELGDYKDAKERSFALWEEIAVRDTIAAGALHTVGLQADGTAVAAGLNGSGQCNVAGWRDIVAISAGGAHTVGLQADGTAVAAGLNGNGQCNVSRWTDIVAISAGGSHTVGLKEDGTVVAVGDNAGGRCYVDSWWNIVDIAAGLNHTVGLREDGTVVATGKNVDGQCNVDHWADIVAVAAGGDCTVGLKADGSVMAVGWNEYGQCDVAGWSDIVAVSAGYRHTVGLKADGTVVAVGDNRAGQCNVSDWTDIVAISAGSAHTVGLKADGTVVAVGISTDGQCDVDGWFGIKLPRR